MISTKVRRQPARLSFKDGEVLVTPNDQDIFLINAERAVEACQHAIKNEERVSSYKRELLIPLSEWCVRNAEQIKACYIAPLDCAVLQVYVVASQEEYDFELTKRLSDLSYEFSESGWSVHASQISACSDEELSAIFNLNTALKIYGE